MKSLLTGLCLSASVFALAAHATATATTLVTQGTQAPPTKVAVPAIPVADFLNSLGVVTKVDQGYNYQNYIPALQYIGVHNVRDGISNTDALIAMHQQAGAEVDLINSSCNLSGVLAAAHTLVQGNALLSIEGPNEPNNEPVCGGAGPNPGSNWVPVAQYQTSLYTAVKADPVLNTYPVFGVSEVGAENDNTGMQWLVIPTGSNVELPDGTAYADYINNHNYVSGNCGGYVDNQAWMSADPSLNGCWDGMYGNASLTWLKKFPGYPSTQLSSIPRVTTETGWDSVVNPGGLYVQGIILVNTYLDQFVRGWAYTFIYELGNGEGGGGNQGLFNNDWTPRPAATYIHNLTTILADPGTLTTPGSLAFTVLNASPTVHTLLMQKSNGKYELAIWDEQVQGNSYVSIKLGAVSTVNVYDTTEGTTPVRMLQKARNIFLTLSDHADIVEITQP
jgi:hypothetical protein